MLYLMHSPRMSSACIQPPNSHTPGHSHSPGLKSGQNAPSRKAQDNATEDTQNVESNMLEPIGPTKMVACKPLTFNITSACVLLMYMQELLQYRRQSFQSQHDGARVRVYAVAQVWCRWGRNLHLLAVSRLGRGMDLRLSAAAGLLFTLLPGGSIPGVDPDSELRLREGMTCSPSLCRALDLCVLAPWPTTKAATCCSLFPP